MADYPIRWSDPTGVPTARAISESEQTERRTADSHLESLALTARLARWQQRTPVAVRIGWRMWSLIRASVLVLRVAEPLVQPRSPCYPTLDREPDCSFP